MSNATASPDLQQKLKAWAHRTSPEAVAKELDISPNTLTRITSGFKVRSATLFQVEEKMRTRGKR